MTQGGGGGSPPRTHLELVRHEDDGAPAQERTTNGVAEQVRGDVRIDGRQDVVEQDDRAARVDGARQRDAGLLAAREVHAALPDLSRVPGG